jgi:hypothetical protein
MRGGIGVSPRKNKLKHKKSWREKGGIKNGRKFQQEGGKERIKEERLNERRENASTAIRWGRKGEIVAPYEKKKYFSNWEHRVEEHVSKKSVIY